MRDSITDVLQKKSTGSDIVPCFNSKCTNYYSNFFTDKFFGVNKKKTNQQSIFNVIHEIIYKNKISLELETNPKIKFGLVWNNVGDEPPVDGTKLDDNQELIKELLEGKKMFTRKDIQKFNITDIQNNSYIKVGDNYFKTSEEINKEEIAEELSGAGVEADDGLIYCVCLVINNTYHENGNINKFTQNPPKIPYIDLTEGFTELNRFRKRHSLKEENQFSLIFKHKNLIKNNQYDDNLIDDILKKKIKSITGYDYINFITKKFNFQIFQNIQNYMEYCYKKASNEKGQGGNGLKSISKKKLKEITDLYSILDASNKDNDNLSAHVKKNEKIKKIEKVINDAEKYLNSIYIMNATSVIGTLDFADEISKYNLNYNKCSIVQTNLHHGLDINESNLDYKFSYSSDYDYLKKFKDHGIENPSHMISGFKNDILGVHLLIPRHSFITEKLWPLYFLPSILNLCEQQNIYSSLTLNKMSNLEGDKKFIDFSNNKLEDKLNRIYVKFHYHTDNGITNYEIDSLEPEILIGDTHSREYEVFNFNNVLNSEKPSFEDTFNNMKQQDIKFIKTLEEIYSDITIINKIKSINKVRKNYFNQVKRLHEQPLPTISPTDQEIFEKLEKDDLLEELNTLINNVNKVDLTPAEEGKDNAFYKIDLQNLIEHGLEKEYFDDAWYKKIITEKLITNKQKLNPIIINFANDNDLQLGGGGKKNNKKKTNKYRFIKNRTGKKRRKKSDKIKEIKKSNNKLKITKAIEKYL